MPTAYLEPTDPDLAAWFPLAVVRKGWSSRKWDWVALMADLDPDNYPPGAVPPHESRWLVIPGKHRNWHLACDALEDMLATRH